METARRPSFTDNDRVINTTSVSHASDHRDGDRSMSNNDNFVACDRQIDSSSDRQISDNFVALQNDERHHGDRFLERQVTREHRFIQENPNAGCHQCGAPMMNRGFVQERPIIIERPVYVERIIERPVGYQGTTYRDLDGDGIGQHAKTRHGFKGWLHEDHQRELSREQWEMEHGKRDRDFMHAGAAYGPSYYGSSYATSYYGPSYGSSQHYFGSDRGSWDQSPRKRGGFLSKLLHRGRYNDHMDNYNNNNNSYHYGIQSFGYHPGTSTSTSTRFVETREYPISGSSGNYNYYYGGRPLSSRGFNDNLVIDHYYDNDYQQHYSNAGRRF